MFERPSIGGNSLLVQTIDCAWRAYLNQPSALDAEALFRDFIMRLRRELGYRALYAPSLLELQPIIDEQLEKSVAALSGIAV